MTTRRSTPGRNRRSARARRLAAVPGPDFDFTSALSSQEEMIAAIPYLLGFVPHRSVVALGFRPMAHTLSVTARVDLPTNLEDAQGAGHSLAVGLLRSGASTACLVIYWDSSEGVEDRDELILPILDVCDAAGLRIECCVDLDVSPAVSLETMRLGPIPDFAVASVVAGNQVMATRADIERRVSATPDGIRPSVLLALRGLAELSLPRADLAAAFDGVLSSAASARDAGVCRPSLSADEIATVALALRDIGIRDGFLGELSARPTATYDDLLAQLCQVCPDEEVAPAAAVLAAAAYLRGNGVLARCAVQRALQVEPSYSFARLLEVALDNALPPQLLHRACGPPEASP